MKAVIVCKKVNPNFRWAESFAEGLRRHGWSASIKERPEPCDLLVQWGVRDRHGMNLQQQIGGKVCIIERGYIGDRFSWTSVSFGGGLNGHGEFCGPFDDDSRWKTHFADKIKPWRFNKEGPAVVMGQVPTDMSLKGLDSYRLWTVAVRKLKAAGWDVKWRGHPLANGFTIDNLPLETGPLEDCLNEAGFVVTINSNSGVDAVLAGVPTVTMDDRSMAWDVTSHDTEEMVMPDRTEWAHALAWKQWLLPEMASGYCWDMVAGDFKNG